jgi:hypothetical protein
MSIATILTVATKHISWGKVANIALEYGPGIVRKIRERLQACPAEKATVEQLGERIRELESALIRQEEIIDRQNRNMELLEEIGKTLQARLNIFMALSAFSALLSLLLLVLWLRK